MSHFFKRLALCCAVALMPASAWIVPVDVDADGDVDLIGTISTNSDAEVLLWVNEGMKNVPTFRLQKSFGKDAALVHPSRDQKSWRLISPGIDYLDWQKQGLEKQKKIDLMGADLVTSIWTLADYNGDGHSDIIVFSQKPGDAKVQIFYGRANGTYASPFSLTIDGKELDSSDIRCAHFVNMDEDDDLDLVCLNSQGALIYYENRNTNSEPLYAAGQVLRDSMGKQYLIPRITSFTPCDWNGDGHMDLLIICSDGVIGTLQHTGRYQSNIPVLSVFAAFLFNAS